MALVLQVYAPLPASEYHRVLHVFACPAQAAHSLARDAAATEARGLSERWRVFRSQLVDPAWSQSRSARVNASAASSKQASSTAPISQGAAASTRDWGGDAASDWGTPSPANPAAAQVDWGTAADDWGTTKASVATVLKTAARETNVIGTDVVPAPGSESWGGDGQDAWANTPSTDAWSAPKSAAPSADLLDSLLGKREAARRSRSEADKAAEDRDIAMKREGRHQPQSAATKDSFSPAPIAAGEASPGALRAYYLTFVEVGAADDEALVALMCPSRLAASRLTRCPLWHRRSQRSKAMGTRTHTSRNSSLSTSEARRSPRELITAAGRHWR